MTKEDFAKNIDGREIDSLLSADDCLLATENNLVVVFACSDDRLELEGSMIDEFGCYMGGAFYYDFNSESWVDIDDSFEGVDLEEDCPIIYAICNDKSKYEGFWFLETNLPHCRFEAKMNGELFCSGFVFDYTELNKKTLNE
jgi:hypothetical protein